MSSRHSNRAGTTKMSVGKLGAKFEQDAPIDAVSSGTYLKKADMVSQGTYLGR